MHRTRVTRWHMHESLAILGIKNIIRRKYLHYKRELSPEYLTFTHVLPHDSSQKPKDITIFTITSHTWITAVLWPPIKGKLPVRKQNSLTIVWFPQLLAFLQYFVTRLIVYGDELLLPRPTPKLKDHPLSVIRDCLFNIGWGFSRIGCWEGYSVRREVSYISGWWWDVRLTDTWRNSVSM